jgi:outer membrane protein OmpA-like peptidoglycan-associated protein
MRKSYFYFFCILMMLGAMTTAILPQDQTEDQSLAPLGMEERQEQKGVKKIYKLTKAYIYRKESLVISETDLLCSYFIRSERIPKDLYITGSELMKMDRKAYSDGDHMFINLGTADGIQEGDVFSIVQEGKRIYHGVTKDKMGYLYLKKGLATVTCAHENNAEITLSKTCNPIHFGDILIPYKPAPLRIEEKIVYQRCRLPKAEAEGYVAYMNLHVEDERTQAGQNDYITIDAGKAVVSRGDWIVFYEEYGNDMPWVAMGSGIVINAEHNNATVRIEDSVFPIEVGTRWTLFTRPEPTKVQEKTNTASTPGEREKLPILETLRKENAEAEGKEVLEVDVFFDLNDTSIKDVYKNAMNDVRQFIGDNPDYEVVLSGYCCSIGGFEYNLKLSQKRVNTVKKYLMETFNLKEDVFESNFYGEKDAPFDNSTEEQRRKNRLVRVQVIEK